MVKVTKPKLGERIADFACGTGGFLTSTLFELDKQVGNSLENKLLYSNSIYGIEKKALPHLLCVTNMLIHDIDEPQILHDNSLEVDYKDMRKMEKFDIILMNPPYGGNEKESVKSNFPRELRSAETADLFMNVIMYRLKKNGKCAVIVPEGFLFGTDNAKVNIKRKLFNEFNVHTILRLPHSIFAPYTSIHTNILFFDNTEPTNETWFYRVDMPEGYKNFSKTRPMQIEHFNETLEWWNDREEIDHNGQPKAKKYLLQEIIDRNFDIDLCGFSEEEEIILEPLDLINEYQEKRISLNNKKDSIVYSSRAPIGYIAITKNEICTNQGFKSLVPNIKEVSDYIFYCLQAKTKDIIKRAPGTTFKEISGKEFGNTLIPLPPLLEQKRIVSKIEEITEINEKFPEKLKKSILQYATRGKLTKQNLNNTGHDLYKNLIVKRNELIENGSIKRNKNYENINSNHLPFDIPDSWKWVRLGDIAVLKMGKTPPRSESQYWSLDIPWVSIADMVSNNLTKNTKEKISNYALETKFNNILSPKGTLIMSFKLTIGKVSILDMDAVHNEAIVSIFPFINHDNIIRNYLFKTLPLLVEYANTKSAIKGKTLNSTSLNNLMIPLPSLEEQKQIVEEIINFENYVNTLQIL
ncbi:N-6 DNA methylase [Staphylococcus pseudintermedius]|uniref:N-6 DNA methylase n=1 Tax=Staphylococcus pseudintermedius TaxID=283734 RepID=UPI001D21C20A|nr:N-6 DNA methylase [Staphylococcus pseudintermedius]EHS7220371.1 N-6 DNA methylase [Staphylococcus pseudintermedius]EHT1784205.1 N-6 DNA methylase [Staphylococcus pseudintermedius]EHT3480744.1 N-6 DNA methylase [Staphylococcus pseudintermedius]EII2684296.1 N-6 DNA methylase [Staphylococcus pseudintermedius]EIQ0627843.1 N-6 DNA methylase [Staphylococcus pseudintermedius]